MKEMCEFFNVNDKRAVNNTSSTSKVFEQKIIYDLKQENELLRRKLLGKFIGAPALEGGMKNSSFVPVPTPRNNNLLNVSSDAVMNENMSKYNIKGRLVDSQINLEEMVKWSKENHIPQR